MRLDRRRVVADIPDRLRGGEVPALKTASYAVMFTDIKGFTERTSRQTRAENERLLRLHDALLLPVIGGYGGNRVKTIGDAYLVVFDSATRAIACGAALQDRLALYNRKVDAAEHIEVRVAINAGEVRVERDDVYGEAVNIAARVEECADAGEVCLTEAVYLLADRTWIEVDDLGPHSLRGLPEPVRLYRLHRTPDAGLPYGGAALSTLRLPDPDPTALARRRFGMRTLKRGIALAIALALIAAAAIYLLDRESPLQRIAALADGGQPGAAERALQSLPAGELGEAERIWLEGVVAQARGHQTRAIQRFAAAGTLDRGLAEKRAAPRLIAMLGDERCEVRADAARALGDMPFRVAREELQYLSAREPADAGFLDRLRAGGCNAGDAAREALERISEDR